MANCIRCGRQLSGFSIKKICPWCVQHEAQQRGELAEDAPQPVIRQPWVRRGESAISLTQVFFGINIAVYLAMVLSSGTPFQEFTGELLVRWGANAGELTLSGEWWRLLTCVFVHGGLLHIAFNMWCLWDLGALSESLYGRGTFFVLYLTCGLGASLASVIWNPHVLSVGASGAIFGLAGALIAAFKLGEFSLPRAALSGTLRSLMIFVVFNLIFGAASGVTDNAAHIGGLITGLILGALIAVAAPHGPALRRAAIFVLVLSSLAGGAAALAAHYGFPLRLGRATDSPIYNPTNVVAQLQRLVRQKPKFVPAHIALAKAYMQQRQFGPAENELQRALEIDPRNNEARIDLGMLYLNQDRAPDAQAAFSQAITQDANSADAHYGMGLSLAGQHNDQAAIDEYKTAARLDPQLAGVNYDLGLSDVRLKNYDDAVAAFLKERQQSGDSREIEDQLAQAYAAKGMTQEAEEARKKAEQLK
ncbi:MAG TPA: rhomboid family intramembrane serine protease [Candidatus Binatia bacterium]|nr:rhomboid family intramembrane serine protease [Candidatus Binatia bacterium]